MSGRLAAVLAFLLPSRGRHSGHAAPAAAVPDEPDAEDEAADLTMFDLPTGRVPPYMRPADEDGAP